MNSYEMVLKALAEQKKLENMLDGGWERQLIEQYQNENLFRLNSEQQFVEHQKLEMMLGPKWEQQIIDIESARKASGIHAFELGNLNSVESHILGKFGTEHEEMLRRLQTIEQLLPLWKQLEDARQGLCLSVTSIVPSIADYRLFANTDLERIVEQVRLSASDLEWLGNGALGEIGIRAARIGKPWISMQYPDISLGAFTHLAAVSDQLQIAHPFAVDTNDLVTGLLGDWHDQLPDDFATMSGLARTELALARGFDQSVLSIPAIAYPATVGAAGFGVFASYSPTITGRDYGTPVSADAGTVIDHDEIATDTDHQYLYALIRRLEQELRKWLNQEMQKHFGANWIKQTVHGNVTDEWKARREKEKPPLSSELIDYADFGDLLSVMQRKDIWLAVCEPYFLSKDDFATSYKRLIVIRNPISHARTVTKVDYLCCQIEAVRILKAIGIEMPIQI